MSLQKLNDLDKRIKEMENALSVFSNFHNVRRGIGNDIKSKLVVKTEKSLHILGRRWFGCGNYETEFILPFDMVQPLERLIKSKISELEKEYNLIKKAL